jgi:hypothetical protein
MDLGPGVRSLSRLLGARRKRPRLPSPVSWRLAFERANVATETARKGTAIAGAGSGGSAGWRSSCNRVLHIGRVNEVAAVRLVAGAHAC